MASFIRKSKRPVIVSATFKVALGILALLAIGQFVASVLLPGSGLEGGEDVNSVVDEGGDGDGVGLAGVNNVEAPDAGMWVAGSVGGVRLPLESMVGGEMESNVPLVRTTPPEKPSQVDLRVVDSGVADIEDPELRRLVASAIQHRRAGDMMQAVAQLHGAMDIAPQHPRVLFELGATYEEMQITDKAADRYQQVARLGKEGAGPLYEIAYRKITEGLHTFTTTAPTEEPLYISEVQEFRSGNSLEGQQVLLHVSLMAKPDVKIKIPDVAVQVNFFDLKNSREVVPTRSDPAEYEWKTAPVEWAGGDPEMVSVRYFMPPLSPGEIVAHGELSYYGYVIDVYYEGRLVDSVARPRRLGRLPMESAIIDDFPLFEDRGLEPVPDGLLPSDFLNESF